MRIEVDLREMYSFANMLPYIGGAVWEASQRGLVQWGNLIRRRWISLADKEIKRQSGQYIRTIFVRYPENNDPFSAAVVAPVPYASVIEYGSKPHDLKPGLLNSPRARVTKSGKRYIIVPFRHKIPSSLYSDMPKVVYQEAKRLEPSRIVSRFRDERSVIRYRYHWGGRITEEHLNEMAGMGLITPLQAQRLAGMVRMHGVPHSAYLTFRTVSENSPGGSWVHPGTPAHHFAERSLAATETEGRQLIEMLIAKALKDLIR